MKDATEKNIDYFLNFNDPTIYERMMGCIIHAILDHAIRCMIKNGSSSTTPNDVLMYMKEIAAESPIAMQILSLMFHWELALLVRKCERNNNAREFFDSLCMFLPLFCVTNSTEYTKICCDLIKYWSTCSDLEKEIVAKYCFTLETGTGVQVGLDYCFGFKCSRDLWVIKLKSE